MFTTHDETEAFRDGKWRREEIRRIETAAQVEEFVEELGFCLGLTDARTNLPSVYIAVCGRRDAFTPKNVQKDYECSLAWTLKDEVMQRGRVFYAKLTKNRATFLAPRMIPVFNAIWGIPRAKESSELSPTARVVLAKLREEWEMGTSDLREECGIVSRTELTKALDELQKCLKVIPQEVLYKPKFTYIWTLAEARFPAELGESMTRDEALVKLARTFLLFCGRTELGELARAFGLKRAEAGRANHRLVDEGFAVRLERGVYALADAVR